MRGGRHGAANNFWKGGRTKSLGYAFVRAPEHPRAHNGYVQEHVLICEKALGRYLPAFAEPHHVNRIRDDNRSSNLVICENRSYHALLHARQRIVDAGGNPDTEGICCGCKVLKSLSLFATNKWKQHGVRPGFSLYCMECSRSRWSRDRESKREVPLILNQIRYAAWMRDHGPAKWTSFHAFNGPETLCGRKPQDQYGETEETLENIGAGGLCRNCERVLLAAKLIPKEG